MQRAGSARLRALGLGRESGRFKGTQPFLREHLPLAPSAKAPCTRRQPLVMPFVTDDVPRVVSEDASRHAPAAIGCLEPAFSIRDEWWRETTEQREPSPSRAVNASSFRQPQETRDPFDPADPAEVGDNGHGPILGIGASEAPRWSGGRRVERDRTI